MPQLDFLERKQAKVRGAITLTLGEGPTLLSQVKSLDHLLRNCNMVLEDPNTLTLPSLGGLWCAAQFNMNKMNGIGRTDSLFPVAATVSLKQGRYSQNSSNLKEGLCLI